MLHTMRMRMISGGGTLNIKYIMCVYSLASLFWANAVHGCLAGCFITFNRHPCDKQRALGLICIILKRDHLSMSDTIRFLLESGLFRQIIDPLKVV